MALVPARFIRPYTVEWTGAHPDSLYEVDLHYCGSYSFCFDDVSQFKPKKSAGHVVSTRRRKSCAGVVPSSLVARSRVLPFSVLGPPLASIRLLTYGPPLASIRLLTYFVYLALSYLPSFSLRCCVSPFFAQPANQPTQQEDDCGFYIADLSGEGSQACPTTGDGCEVVMPEPLGGVSGDGYRVRISEVGTDTSRCSSDFYLVASEDAPGPFEEGGPSIVVIEPNSNSVAVAGDAYTVEVIFSKIIGYCPNKT